MAPGSQMIGLMNGGVGVLPQCDISVKVAPGCWAAGHGHGAKGDGLIPPHGDNTPQKGVAPNSSRRTGHNTSHNGVVGHQIHIWLCPLCPGVKYVFCYWWWQTP